MELEVKIKEEPAWLEGTTTASLENFEHVSEVIALKEEVKSDLTEPGSSLENSLEVICVFTVSVRLYTTHIVGISWQVKNFRILPNVVCGDTSPLKSLISLAALKKFVALSVYMFGLQPTAHKLNAPLISSPPPHPLLSISQRYNTRSESVIHSDAAKATSSHPKGRWGK
ncbi:uncharacterized protein [Anabrus simplex]|uniref:uncharacterized protein n=1 Tax=Anabrus simplex TaxID=316456 RepID=UPI0035A3053C